MVLVTPPIKILKIGQHMKQKPDANNSNISFKKQHHKIDCNRIIGMQKMKAYTASVRIENRIGKQMIQIHKHGCQKNQIHFFPMITIKNQSNKNRENKMQEVVYKSF